MQREDIKMLVHKWWDIYNDVSLDYKPLCASETPVDDVDLEPLEPMGHLSKVVVQRVLAAPSAA